MNIKHYHRVVMTTGDFAKTVDKNLEQCSLSFFAAFKQGITPKRTSRTKEVMVFFGSSFHTKASSTNLIGS